MLDFVHAQNHIHRDVKPANILFDRHGNAFLGDFGIIKALGDEEGGDWRGSSLTAPGFLLGTPNYVAPEIVMGRPFDGRVDQYALAMTVHEVLSGFNCMEGPTPSATVVNQTMVVPPALEELIPGIPADCPTRSCAGCPRTRPSGSRAARRWPGRSWPRCPGRRGPSEATVLVEADVAGQPRPRALPGLRRAPCRWAASTPAAVSAACVARRSRRSASCRRTRSN